MISWPQRGQVCCDDSTRTLVLKRVIIDGEEAKKCPTLRDVIYGRPLTKPCQIS